MDDPNCTYSHYECVPQTQEKNQFNSLTKTMLGKCSVEKNLHA